MVLSKFQRARRRVLNRIVPFKCILGDENNDPYAPEDGYYWVRRFDRADSNGNNIPGIPFRVRSGTALVVPRGGRQVWVGTGLDGHLTVLGFVHEDLVQASVKIDPRSAQPNDPYRQWIRLKQIQNFRALPLATGNTGSMKVEVRQCFYYTETGDLVRYNGTNASTHINLTAYVPALNFQRYALLWLRTYNPNALSDIQVTVSTPIDSLNLALSFDDLQECADNADADAIPIQAFRLHDAQTTLKMDDTIDVDLRPFFNMPQVYGFPNVVTRHYRAHENHSVIMPDVVTIASGGAVQIQTGGVLVILDTTDGGSGGSGGVTDVTATAPITSTGGTTPNIALTTPLVLQYGGTHADLSATGGANQFLKQVSAGSDVTVAPIVSADLTTALTTPPPIGGTTANTGAFTTLKTPLILPPADSTSAIIITKADGTTPIMTFDTTNKRVGIGAAPGANEKFVVTAQAVADAVMTAKGMTAQTGALIRAADSTNAKVFTVDKDAAVVSTLNAADDPFLTSFLPGDTNPRFIVEASGKHAWGAGSGAAVDLTLERSANGVLKWVTTVAATSTVTDMFIMSAASTGTPAASFGLGLAFRGMSASGAERELGRIRTLWTTATDASRVSNMIFSVYNVGTETDIITLLPTGARINTLSSGAAPSTTYNFYAFRGTASAGSAAFRGESNLGATTNLTDVSVGYIQLNANVANSLTSIQAPVVMSVFNYKTSSATIARLSGVQTAGRIDEGIITDYAHFRAAEWVTGGVATGVIATQYGLYLPALTTGVTNYAIVTNSGHVVFNENGSAVANVRIEGDTEQNLLFTDSVNDRVGIGLNAPLARLHVRNTGAITNSVVNVEILDYDSTGTPAAGLGVGVLFKAESSVASTFRETGRLSGSHFVATDASQQGDLTAEAYYVTAGTSTPQEGWRIRGASGGLQMSWFGLTPVSRPAAYTQTYATATRTLAAYTSDPESGAYTGIDNLQVGTVYAQLTDLNTLRVAYENLRVLAENTTQLLNSVLDDIQLYGLLQ